LYETLSALLLFKSFIVELLAFGEDIAYFLYYLYFYVGIYTSESKFFPGVLISYALCTGVFTLLR
jgi:hypothetical protein